MNTTVKVATKGLIARLGKATGTTVFKRVVDGDVSWSAYTGKVKGGIVGTSRGLSFWGKMDEEYKVVTLKEGDWMEEDDLLREILPITFPKENEDDVNVIKKDWTNWNDLFALIESAPKRSLKKFCVACDSGDLYPTMNEALNILRRI